jgi:hypothetical protein
MRALGPGSVSSFLKVILDVFYVVLWIFAGLVGLGVLVALLLSFKPELFEGLKNLNGADVNGPWAGPALAATLVGIGLYALITLVIVSRLRRIFQTLTAGDPFHPDNVRRLRVIGVALAILELGRYAAAALAAMAFPGHNVMVGGGVNLTTWFAVLVIFVLAEVFREGARLRRDAELTI